MPMTYIFLIASVLCEVVATTSLKMSNSFTRLMPSLVSVLMYASAFYLLTYPMKILPTGVIYAIWSGAGIVLISIVGVVFLNQKLDFGAIMGIMLILAGVIVINVFSNSSVH